MSTRQVVTQRVCASKQSIPAEDSDGEAMSACFEDTGRRCRPRRPRGCRPPARHAHPVARRRSPRRSETAPSARPTTSGDGKPGPLVVGTRLLCCLERACGSAPHVFRIELRGDGRRDLLALDDPHVGTHLVTDCVLDDLGEREASETRSESAMTITSTSSAPGQSRTVSAARLARVSGRPESRTGRSAH